MNYIQFPYYAQSVDGLARVKFTDFGEFKILKSTSRKKIELEKKDIPKCNDSSYWIKAPDDITKDFYYEVIDGLAILKKLYTDIGITMMKNHFDKELIKTGRVFEL